MYSYFTMTQIILRNSKIIVGRAVLCPFETTNLFYAWNNVGNSLCNVYVTHTDVLLVQAYRNTDKLEVGWDDESLLKHTEIIVSTRTKGNI